MSYDDWKLATPPEYDEAPDPESDERVEVTGESITDEEINELGRASVRAGDFLTAMWCDHALVPRDGMYDVPRGCERAPARAVCARILTARQNGGKP